MTVADKTGPLVSRAETRVLLHDLRGPLVTMAGISHELELAIEQMASQLESLSLNVPEKDAANLDRIFNDDIAPCMHHLTASIKSLSCRVDAFREANRIKDSD